MVHLLHKKLYNFKKEEHKNTKWGTVFSNMGCLCLSKPMLPPSPPVNLWTTGTKGRYAQCLSTMCCVCQQCHCHCENKCHLHMNGHQSDSNVSTITSRSVRFCSVAILHQSEVTQLITQHNQTLCTAQPYVFHHSEVSRVK